jgi:shikimate dehydrogenase
MYGLIGEKLGHSYSKIIHEKFGRYHYELFPLQQSELQGFMQRKDWKGINVTIPYKKSVMPFCDALSAAAQKIGSVNTVVRRPDGTLYGDNTDYSGFLHMASKAEIDFSGKKVLVLGSGGTGLTACAAVKDQGGSPVVISRTGENNYENLFLHKDAAVMVNTTPAGMFPDTEASPLNLSLFPYCQAVLDVVYNPLYTRLLIQAAELGMACSGGLSMLVYQAKAACELFTGSHLDEKMTEEIENELRREHSNIVLIGMPGSGKTTVGKLLAKQLALKFEDTDAAVESACGMSIPTLFKEKGEAEFRRLEAEQCQKFGCRSGQVIATGGGIVKDPLNYGRLKQNGTLLFLKRELDSLSTYGRPLSRNRQELEMLYHQRIGLYEKFADYTVDSNDSISKTVKKAREALRR